jgi:hypothetical protein
MRINRLGNFGVSADTHRAKDSSMVGHLLKFSNICDDPYEEFQVLEPQKIVDLSEVVQKFAGTFVTLGSVAQDDSVEKELAELRDRVQYLESLVLRWQDSASYFEVQNAIVNVESITREVFGGTFERKQHEDSEIAGDNLFEINVRCAGSIDEIVKKQEQWHSKLADLPFQTRRLFHLSVDPVD